MSSILRVCLSSELPAENERLSNYYYFLYDRLILYKGSEKIDSNYSISESMPENPVPNMLYILHDGSIHQYLDYEDKIIAEIEDASQVEYIQKAGTTYFVNSDSRYIDKHDRTLVMPFNDETYDLVVDYRDEDIFDNDTIVKYNEESGRFELYSGEEKYEEYSRSLKGKDTSSVKTEINGSRLEAQVIVSKSFGNALKTLSDGLFVRTDNKVDKDTFNTFYRQFKDLKSYCYAILDGLEANINYLASIITKDAISEEIHSQLVVMFPSIDQAISNYDEVRSRLNDVESSAMTYAGNAFANVSSDLEEKIGRTNEWDNMNEDIDEYTHEVDYYEKAKNYDNEMKYQNVISIVIGIDMYNKNFVGIAAITTAIEMYNADQTNIAIIASAIDYYNKPDTNNIEAAAAVVSIDLYENSQDNIAAIVSAIDDYNKSDISDNSEIAATVLALDAYNNPQNNLAVIATAIDSYNEPDAIDSESVAVSLAVELYDND